MARMSYASVFFLILIRFSWVKCYEVSYCDDEKSRKIEYSNIKLEPYPIKHNEKYTLWIDLDVLETVPCTALIQFTAVKCGEDKSKCDKNMTIPLPKGFQMIKNCMGDDNAKYPCITDRSNMFAVNEKSCCVQPGLIHICIDVPKIFSPGCYDVYMVVLVSSDEVISCYQTTGVQFV
ncbi:uncharacterized protein [Centruroides vittatus]|uniref:uncharacterized protein n=1 Tax=Centruroides vittatus TaxID=120091 RepID=UPI00350F1B84